MLRSEVGAAQANDAAAASRVAKESFMVCFDVVSECSVSEGTVS